METLGDKIKDSRLVLNIKAKINGREENLTKQNYKEYIGKEVINFKDVGSGTEEIEISEDGTNKSNKYIVSTKYRLYYIDFDNKYGDGKGTIYLKADCTSNNYKLELDATGADKKTEKGTKQVKIKQLNPSLYVDETKTPAKENPNMQGVTWLLNENNWSGLKSNLKDGVIEQLNYIVGAPSIEMMIDSYNTHYNLMKQSNEPVPGDITEGGERKRLFCRYNGNEIGYEFGPSLDKDYAGYTAKYTIQTDSHIDTMYYPGNNNGYWLSSPCISSSKSVCRVYYDQGGYISSNVYENSIRAFCPLVSLNSSFKLELKENN